MAYRAGMAGKSGEDRTSFGSLIREERRRRRWTQEDLAVAADVGVRSVVRWENGQTRPDPEQLRAVVDALRIDHDVALTALGWRSADEDEQVEPAPFELNGPDEREIWAARTLSADERVELITYLRARRTMREETQRPAAG